MSSRAEILSATKSKGNKKSTLARNGRWNSTNSGAFLRAPSVAVGPGAAGSSEKATANFFNALIKDVVPMGAKMKEQKDKEQVNFGKASWTRATKEQREKWSFAIKNGHAFEGDSPYFRQGVAIAHTEAMAGRYAQEMFQKYEDWTDKNDETSGSFDEWINGQDETWQSSFEHIDDEVLTNHFLPMQAQIRDRLRTQHTQRLNENFRTESYYEKQNQVFTKLRNYFGSIAEEGTQDPTMGFGPLIVRGKEGNQYNVETIGMVKALLDKKNPTEADFMKVPNGPAMWKHYNSLSKKKKENITEKEAVSVSQDIPQTNNVTEDINPSEKKESNLKLSEEHRVKDFNLMTTFNSLEEVSESLGVTDKELNKALRDITRDVSKGKFTSFTKDGKTTIYDDLSFIHPKNWTPTQKQKLVEALEFNREGGRI